jgi:pyruvate formate lyase activating enzyme
MSGKRAAGGIVFNVQRYSIHDGPGIRTTVFLKGCPLSCFWCQNPESQRVKPEIFFNQENCLGCGLCVARCPNHADTLADGRAVIDRTKCKACGQCVEFCSGGTRTLIGKYMTVPEVMVEVMKDRKFYERSGGGVTLSGGDPMAQPKFSLALLKQCKEAGLNTAIETCGYTSWGVMEKLLEFTDLVLFDIKCLDSEKHKKATGKSNRRILDNVRKVARCKPLRIRIPVIPGFNDSPEEIGEIVRFARSELGCQNVDLMTYNKMGESKYERLNRPRIAVESMDENRMEELKKIAAVNP